MIRPMGTMNLGGLRWGIAFLACLGTALVAVTVPVRPPDRSAVGAPSNLPSEGAPDVAPEEDLAAFMANRRWGVSLNDLLDAEAAPPAPPRPAEPPERAEPALDPALVEMGYVGLIVAEGRTSVLLASPEGGIARLAPGDTLPDGRTLVSVTDNRLVLGGGGRPEEVLTLFPHVREQAAASVPAPAPASR